MPKTPPQMTVDAFVATRILPQYRPIAERLRALMRQYAPDATELISYGIPTWRMRRGIAVLSPTKKGITFAFSKGASFDDRHGLLEGTGHVSKNVRMSTLEEVNEEALADYIAQALEWEKR